MVMLYHEQYDAVITAIDHSAKTITFDVGGREFVYLFEHAKHYQVGKVSWPDHVSQAGKGEQPERELGPYRFHAYPDNRFRRTALKVVLAFGLLLAGGGVAVAAQTQTTPAPPERAYAEIKVGERTVKIEVPLTPKTKAAGLRGRASLAKDTGMLLFFPENAAKCITTLGVPMPLSVAFVDPDKTILDVHEMKANAHNLHCAVKAKWALLMPTSWYETNGVARRTVVEGLDVDFEAIALAQAKRSKR